MKSVEYNREFEDFFYDLADEVVDVYIDSGRYPGQREFKAMYGHSYYKKRMLPAAGDEMLTRLIIVMFDYLMDSDEEGLEYWSKRYLHGRRADRAGREMALEISDAYDNHESTRDF